MGQVFSSSRLSSFWYDDRLLRACSEGRYHQVVTLVQHYGANVNCYDSRDGDTPLHKACRRAIFYDHFYYHSNNDDDHHHHHHLHDESGSSDDALLHVVDYLLRRGAKVDAVDRGGCTVLMWACVYHDVELVRLLAQRYGANVHLRDPLEQTALHKAHDNLEIVRLLVEECGADVHVRDCFGLSLEDRLTVQIQRELTSREFTNRFDRHVQRAQQVLAYLHSLDAQNNGTTAAAFPTIKASHLPPTTSASTPTTPRNVISYNGVKNDSSFPPATQAKTTTTATTSPRLLARQSARINDSFLVVHDEEQETFHSANSGTHQIACGDDGATDPSTDGLLRDFVQTERVHL
mmetsp:Transcript_11108/g.21257  ORF Transcript_11108/g.21257 Transcript_11108/m.21257 type:complete len:348 (-) Transcript_11108:1449-2492(-)